MVRSRYCYDVPTEEQWTRDVESASPEDLLNLWTQANGCFAVVNEGEDDALKRDWSVRLGIADEALRKRGIDQPVEP
jgi:hypothetical protein